MNFLGLDQAPNNTGWAASSDADNAKVSWGTIRMSDYGDDDQRMIRDFEFDMLGLIDRFKPQWVFFEQIVIKIPINTPVLYSQFTLVGLIQTICMQKNIPCEMVLIGEWRKRFLGRANKPKSTPPSTKGRDWLKEAAEIECARRGHLVSNDHEAEAIGILDYGMASKSFDYKQRTKADVVRRQLAWRRKDLEK